MAISTSEVATKAKTFKSLHVPGTPLVLANVYDATSARIVASLPGCKALATASFALAKSIDKTDQTLTLDENISLSKPIAAVAHEFGLPLTVDIQDGYAKPGDFQTLREVVKRVVVEVGAAGVNLEDSWHESTNGDMIDEEESVERIKAVLKAANDLGVPNFVVNARSDSFLMGGTLEESIRRGKRYLEAGATTVFIIWARAEPIVEKDAQRAIDQLGGRVNLSRRLGKPGPTTADLARMGVARISVGPQLYFAAAQALRDAAVDVFGTSK
jgi:2-methylisocitrate lyase-like PEP mutase family enzyme